MNKHWYFWLIFIIVIFLIAGIIFWQYNLISKSINESSDLFKTELPEKKKKFVVIALGDSLTQAARLSNELYGDNPEYSYATGEKIESFAKRLEQNGNEVEVYNLSVSGATTTSLIKDQLPRAEVYNPDYVLMTIGGNDAMKRADIDTLKENLRTIFSAFPESQILIGNIPNLREFREAPYPSCDTPLVETELDIDSLMELYIFVFNQAISSVAQEFDNVKVVDLFNNLDRTNVSEADCLHFSISGEEKAAELFYAKK